MAKISALKDITIRGNLTRDPELRFTPSGAAVVNFTVAVNDRRFDKATNEWVSLEPAFIGVSAWRNLAENVAESLGRGDAVIVTGSFGPRQYEKDGQTHTVWEMEANAVAADLSHATVKVHRVQRSGRDADASQGAGPSQGSARATQQDAANDPWATSGTPYEEPPF